MAKRWIDTPPASPMAHRSAFKRALEPAPQSHDTPQGGAGSVRDVGYPHETILVVDDDEVVLSLLARALEAAGFTVLTASSGLHGLATWRAHDGEIQLVITDVNMPDMSGPALATTLAESDGEVEVLLMTGGEHRPDGDEDWFIAKPFNLFDVVAKVRAALDGGSGWRVRTELRNG